MSIPSPFEELLAVAKGPAGEAVLVVTGAGISLASGIPTFRGKDPGAVWSKDVTEKGTRAYYRHSPHESWLWYLKRFESLKGAQPNDAHRALVQWQQRQQDHGRAFLLVTQNIDTLHEQAGSRDFVKVHGSSDLARCTQLMCTHGPPSGTLPMAQVDFSALYANPSRETVPRCPVCQSRLRPHVLWFDEYYAEHASYQFDRVIREARKSRLVVFIGTSFSVGITAIVTEEAQRNGAHLFSIDPSGNAPSQDIMVVPEPAEVALPRLVASL